MTRAIILALSLSACIVPNNDEHATAIIDAYEAHYADLSDDDVECIRDVRVRYARRPRDWILDRNDTVGHTVSGVVSTRVWIGRELPEDWETWTIRHELVHALLGCVTGDTHGDHDVPEFGFAAEIIAPGSLVAMADEMEDEL